MRKALLAAMLMPGLSAGSVAVAADLTEAYFSGALSYDGLTARQSTTDRAVRAADRASYTPDPFASWSLTLGPFAGSEDRAFDLYRNKFGPLGLSLGGGYQMSGTGGVEPDSYMLGVKVDYGGVSLGSQWRGRDTGACALSDTFCDAGPTWNIGASYSAGAASLSAQYQAVTSFDAEGQGLEGLGGDVLRLGVDYQIFDGFSSRADAYFIDGENNLTEGDSTVVLIGTRITF
ncbi:porin [Hwanghaeella grinnelliae]|uniref:Porin n=1 Tax=Hwanghaeella grinnelliae TaxID=2500179 RepID=A0A437QHW7_9PROT|nr:porin [Hwanghaeella grinnelliae]RVU34131.1 porin [Hwanghaeella grinnelliae]